jgi:hypothetical protein
MSGKGVGLLLDVLGRMAVWLAHHGRAGLTAEDGVILAPRFEKLSRDAGSVALLSRDLASEPCPSMPRSMCERARSRQAARAITSEVSWISLVRW